jgi:hypothetical protein
MGARSRKLVTTNKSTVVTKSFFDSIVVEDGEGDGCLPDPPRTDESDGFQVFGEFNDLFNQVVASETVPGRRRRQFAERYAMKM